VYEEEINDMLIHVRCLVKSLHVATRVPPEILGMISSYLTEEDLFSTSRVCHHWRSALISSPSLWTRVSCDRVSRTIISLERSKSLPIQLRLKPLFPTAALGNVLVQGREISSLTITCKPHRIPLLRQLFMLSKPSMKQLHIYAERLRGWRAEE